MAIPAAPVRGQELGAFAWTNGRYQHVAFVLRTAGMATISPRVARDHLAAVIQDGDAPRPLLSARRAIADQRLDRFMRLFQLGQPVDIDVLDIVLHALDDGYRAAPAVAFGDKRIDDIDTSDLTVDLPLKRRQPDNTAPGHCDPTEHVVEPESHHARELNNGRKDAEEKQKRRDQKPRDVTNERTSVGENREHPPQHARGHQHRHQRANDPRTQKAAPALSPAPEHGFGQRNLRRDRAGFDRLPRTAHVRRNGGT